MMRAQIQRPIGAEADLVEGLVKRRHARWFRHAQNYSSRWARVSSSRARAEKQPAVSREEGGRCSNHEAR